MEKEGIKFNYDEIPESKRMELVSIVHQAAIAYLEQPGIPEKFERWKKERAEKHSCNRLTGDNKTNE